MKTASALATVVLLIAVGGCSRSEGESDSENAGWTVDHDHLRFEEDLLVTDNDAFYFGRINDIALAENGRIYVADDEAHHVKVLSTEGKLLDTIGTQGEGPGEFDRLSDIVLARDDSLYVLDRSRGRISVFSPEHDFAYSFAVHTDQGGPYTMMVPKQRPGYRFTFFTSVVPGDDARRGVAVRRGSAGGIVGDTLFTTRPPQMLIEQGNGMISIHIIPFSRGPQFVIGSEGIVHYAWNDSLRVTSYDGTGRRIRTVDVPFEAVRVTEADREREMEGWPSEQRAKVGPEIPDTKPAFDRFLVDDHGRYWFKRPTADPEQADWWIADPENQHVNVVSMPSTVDLMVVRDGYAYGRAESEAGAPALVRYRIAER